MTTGNELFLKVSGWASMFESVDRVLKHYKRRIGSEKTKQNVLGFVRSLCKFAGKNPDELVKLDVEDASRFVQAFIDGLADRKRSIRYVNVALAYINTFFRVNGFEGHKKLRVERYFQPSRYRKRSEYVPTIEEIERMTYAARSKRNKAVVVLLYTTGLRNSTLRALTIGDVIEELRSNKTVIKIPVYPEMKERVPEACKGGIPYYTFASKEAVKILKEYLSERTEMYGELRNEEPLFCSESSNVPDDVKRATPIMRKNLQQIIKRTARRAGIEPWRDVTPHCLRKAFESALRNNRLDIKDQEFLIGHILPGSQDVYYDYSKVEDLRGKYATVEFFRETQVNKVEMIKAFAETLGITNIRIKVEKIREEDPKTTEEEAIGKIIKEELGIKPLKTRMLKARRTSMNGGNHTNYDTRIISNNSKLIEMLNQGFDLIKELRDGTYIIRRTCKKV